MNMNTLNNSTLVALAIAITGCVVESCRHKPIEEDAEPMTVEVALPEVDSVVLRKTYPGYLASNKEVALVSRVDGYLRNQAYKSGDFVKTGQVRFEIENDKYLDAVEQAQATLATAMASYDYASKEYEAMKTAFASDAVSQMEVIQAKSNLDQSIASINTAKAALETAQTNLSYCTVRAPYDGHVSSAQYDVGAYLGGSINPVTLAYLYDDALLSALFDITDVGYYEMLKQKADSMHIDYSNIPITFSEPLLHDYTADLSYVAPQIDKSTGTLRLKAKIQNQYGELKGGMYAMIALPYAVEPRALLIKDAAIASNQLGKYVYVVDDQDKVVYTPIEIGDLVNDTMRIVTKGLDEKSRYVTKAILKVRDGMAVNPKVTN
jgi:RND family efflux transporter MFP subunit